MPELEASTVVYVKLPADLVHWMDLHLAELRLEKLRAGQEEARIPTRSSFIRNLLFKARNNGGAKKS